MQKHVSIDRINNLNFVQTILIYKSTIDLMRFIINKVIAKKMSDICTQLIDYHAGEMDIMFEQEYSKFDLSQSCNYGLKMEERCLNLDDHRDISFKNFISDPVESYSETAWKTSQEFQQSKTSIPKTKTIKKNKSKNTEESLQSHSQTLNRPQKYQKRRGEKNKAGYPTKNFLPNFKTAHLEYLQKHVRKDILSSFDLVKTIKQKDGISMKDYESLYRIPQFDEAFKKMFRSKILYRDLLISRSTLEAKMIHQEKVYVFEEAFRTKIFNKIN